METFMTGNLLYKYIFILIYKENYRWPWYLLLFVLFVKFANLRLTSLMVQICRPTEPDLWQWPIL